MSNSSTANSAHDTCHACTARLTMSRVFAYAPDGSLRGVFCTGACADREAPTAKHARLSETTERYVESLNDRERAVLAERFRAVDASLRQADARSVLDRALAKLEQRSAWISVATRLPPRGECVLVRGVSNTVRTPYFFLVAYYDDLYRPNNPWRTFDNDALSDQGLVPTVWRHITDEDRA